jgi:hypothetical protein
MDEPSSPALICDARALPAQMDTVDALARLALEARRDGLALRLWRPSAALRELIALCGLADVLPEDALHQPR